MTIFHYQFDPRGRFATHRHDQEQITYVVGGLLTFVVEGATSVLGPGDLIVIPAGAVHEATAGLQGAEALSIVSPARRNAADLEFLEQADHGSQSVPQG